MTKRPPPPTVGQPSHNAQKVVLSALYPFSALCKTSPLCERQGIGFGTLPSSTQYTMRFCLRDKLEGKVAMNMLRKVVKPVVAVLVVAMTLLSAPIIPAQAAMVGTEQIIESSEATRDSDTARDKVSAFLAREDVHAELQNARGGSKPCRRAVRCRD